MPIHQASILKEWDSGNAADRVSRIAWQLVRLRQLQATTVWLSQRHYLEGLLAITYDLQQGLRAGGVGINDNGDLTRL